MVEYNPTRTEATNNEPGMGQRAKRFVVQETKNMAEERGINDRLANRIDGYREAVGVVRERMQGDGTSRAASYLEDVITSADRITDSLRRGDWRTTRNEARSLAREHPEILLGTAFMVGAFVGRMLRENFAENNAQNSPPTTRSPDVATAGSPYAGV